MYQYLFIFLLLLYFPETIQSQECVGGQIYSNEAFLYGRFEVAMRSAQGDGIVSSFFLYNLDVGCNWPDENNEIDIEMTGNSETIFFTTHYPGPWYYTDSLVPDFNPHDSIHFYAIEWEPGIVRWFVDSQLVNVQNQVFVEGLIYPMRIIMNLWASDAVGWVGQWDPSIMPVNSEYEYTRYFEYIHLDQGIPELTIILHFHGRMSFIALIKNVGPWKNLADLMAIIALSSRVVLSLITTACFFN